LTGELGFLNTAEPASQAACPEGATNLERIDATPYSSAPTSFITPDAITRRGWEPRPVGWLIESSRPLTDEQLATARQIAADAGLTIEARDDHRENTMATYEPQRPERVCYAPSA